MTEAVGRLVGVHGHVEHLLGNWKAGQLQRGAGRLVLAVLLLLLPLVVVNLAAPLLLAVLDLLPAALLSVLLRLLLLALCLAQPPFLLKTS